MSSTCTALSWQLPKASPGLLPQPRPSYILMMLNHYYFQQGNSFVNKFPLTKVTQHIAASFYPRSVPLPLDYAGQPTLVLTILLRVSNFSVTFLQTLESIKLALKAWFQADNPTAFAIPSCTYSSIEALAFPAFANGIYPNTVIDH
jgi:hypothetical protein